MYCKFLVFKKYVIVLSASATKMETNPFFNNLVSMEFAYKMKFGSKRPLKFFLDKHV